MTRAVPFVEFTFNTLYLGFAWVIFVLMLQRYPRLPPSRRRTAFWVVAALFALAFGDSFHLLPHNYAILAGRINHPAMGRWLGLGRAISSFTLSFFYLFLLLYARRKFDLEWDALSVLLVAACVVRLALLFFPQNHWFTAEPTPWKFYRNIPFALQGLGVVGLLLAHANGNRRLRIVASAISASFLFYGATLVGTLWAPIWGVMMLPKTLAYVLAVFHLYRLELTLAPTPAWA
ncbi:MAG: hypothetical protein ACLFU8_12620 [Anaerolineales bacterium]